MVAAYRMEALMLRPNRSARARTSPPFALVSFQDSVLAKGGDGQVGSEGQTQPAAARGSVTAAGVAVDEQVAVDGAWPGGVSVVQVGAQALMYGVGQRHDAAVDVQVAVADVGQAQAFQVTGAQPVERDQRGRGRLGRGPWRPGRL